MNTVANPPEPQAPCAAPMAQELAEIDHALRLDRPAYDETPHWGEGMESILRRLQ